MNKLEELWEKVQRAFSSVLEPEDEQMFSSTVIRQQPDGKYRWFSVSATAVLNRVSEIDSRELFDSFIAIARATNKYPKRDFMHMGRHGESFITGDCDLMYRDGNVYVTSGVYRDTPLARAEIQSRQQNPGYWGDSIEYQALENPEIVKISEEDPSILVFKEGIIRFVSTVPEEIAASEYTGGHIYTREVNRMWVDLNEHTKSAFVTAFGSEEAAQAWWEANPDAINRAIEENGLMTRSVEPEVEPEPSGDEVAPEPEPEPVEPDVVERDVELDDEMLTLIVERVAESDHFRAVVTQLIERLETLDEAVKVSGEATGAINTALTNLKADVEGRLSELEKSDDEKQRDWMHDLPRRELMKPTYRPREVNAGGNAKPEPESVMENWAKYPGQN